MRYAYGSLESELTTRFKFAEDIIKHQTAIIEFSGGESITSLFIDHLRKNSVVVLEIKEEVKICIDKVKSKDFSQIPYPKFNEKIEDTIIRLDQEFHAGLVDHNFKDKILKKYVLKSSDDLSELPLSHYELAIKVADSFENECEGLIAFGSLARDELFKTSDIDLFMLTSNEINIIYKKLQDIFPDSEIIIQKNQFAIYVNDVLVEINIVDKISKIDLFYTKSLVKNPAKSILCGNGHIKDYLEKLIKTEIDTFCEDFLYTMSRLKYYMKSLKRIINKNDIYKYYFHSNIVLHEYVKLKYYMTGKRDFSYLPKDAFSLLNEIEWKSLMFNPADNPYEHEVIVNQLVCIILDKAKDYYETECKKLNNVL
jgi:predicted nucleotidyltransferase